MDAQLYSVITNTTASDADLLQAISRLGKVNESPMFWTRIANDDRYAPWHRTRAVLALFRRHAHFCTSESQLGGMLAPAKWLESSGICDIDMPLTGWIPLIPQAGNTVFYINVFYRQRVYIEVLGEEDLQHFSRLIRGDVSEGAAGGTHTGVILNYAYLDDYDGWLYENWDEPNPRPK